MDSRELSVPAQNVETLGRFDHVTKTVALTLSRRRFIGGGLASGAVLSVARLIGIPPHAAHAATTKYGVAGWFCCGGVYGYCGDEGGGSCTDCENSRTYAAWPRLNRPGYPYCDYVACGESMPEVICGGELTVYNACTSTGLSVTVHSCGPDMASFCGDLGNDCQPPGYYDRIVDLTPRSFELLADLDQGLMSTRVDVW